MTTRGNKYPVPEIIFPNHVLLSVSDKRGLPLLVQGLKDFNPNVMFYSTGGTGRNVVEILGGAEAARENYISVEEFIGMPESEGGLVKTLHPKIHAGLLCERGNPEHGRFINETLARIDITGNPGVYFDMAVVNFYPFENTVSSPDVTPELARADIDIGGPSMVTGAAKNWHSVAVLTRPTQYEPFLNKVRENNGITSTVRFRLADIANQIVFDYRKAVFDYFQSLGYERDVKPELNFVEAKDDT